MTMQLDRSITQRPTAPTAMKLGLKKLRDEFAGLERLDRAELDEKDEDAPRSLRESVHPQSRRVV